MAAPAPSPPTPGRGGFLKRLTPQQKRMAIAVAAGGMLALFVLLRRRGAPAATATTAVSPTDPSAIGGLPADGSTFADNGASAGELNTTLTGIAGGLQNLEDLLNQPVAAPFTDPGLASTPVDTPAVDAAPAQLATTGGIRTAAAALKSKTVVKASAAHAGQPSVYRFVDTDPKKPGYEQKVYLRPATTAKPAPAARPQAAPKLPAGVFLQDSGTRAGLHYIVQSGFRRYESKAGAGNWGKGGVIKI